MGDINCIFCKYKNDSDKCIDMLQNHDYKCPSLSNIFYGKIIKIPVIKQIYEVCSRINNHFEQKKWEKDYISEYETQSMKFVWGVKAYDDLTDCDANLNTMNDIELIYLKDKNKYIVGIETIYGFESEDGKYDYLEYLLQKFADFMDENGYNTNENIYYGYVFGKGLNSEFDSIEECYAMFKLLVSVYCKS